MEAPETEWWPDGTYGGARRAPRRPFRLIVARPDPDADKHLAALAAAVYRQRRPTAREQAAAAARPAS